MSPVHNWDPTGSRATLKVLPKGEYEVVCGEPKSFHRKNQAGDDTYGIRSTLTVVGGPEDGEKIIYSGYLHTDGAQSFTKQFLMAVYGYERTDTNEKKFDEAHGTEDWSIEFETGHVGDGWRKIMGARLILNADVTPNRDRPDEMMQQIKGFRPFEAAENL